MKPQLLQNAEPEGLTRPHFEHADDNFLPHATQKFELFGLEFPQALQI